MTKHSFLIESIFKFTPIQTINPLKIKSDTGFYVKQIQECLNIWGINGVKLPVTGLKNLSRDCNNNLTMVHLKNKIWFFKGILKCYKYVYLEWYTRIKIIEAKSWNFQKLK